MRSLVMMVFALFMMAGSAFAHPVVLKCITSDGKHTADLTIDLTKKEMRWASMQYDIIHVNDKYLSAYERKGNNVGDEIWVIDRRTGEYKRGFVGMFFNEGETPDKAKLTALTHSGRCLKRQF